MSNDKAIEHGKLKRRPYRGAKAVDKRCRDGTCKVCRMVDKYKRERRDKPEVSE